MTIESEIKVPSEYTHVFTGGLKHSYTSLAAYMLDPIQNNVVFLTFFHSLCQGSLKTAYNRLKDTGSNLFSLIGRV